MKGKPLRLLMIEDFEDDALLLLRELRRGGYDPVFARVETQEAMQEALATQEWNLVIADYVLPGFSGLAALELLQGTGLDLPFIIVSGNIGEDLAVGAMKAGAHDYIMKGHLKRLVPAVERELREAGVRRERRRAEERLRESEKRLRYLSAELMVAQEKERKRIAGELHDSVAASLSAVKFMIEKIAGQAGRREKTREEMGVLISRLQQVIEETRRIMSDLRPSMLDDLGVVPAIHWLCREFEKTYSGIAVAKELGVEDKDIPDSLRTPIFRICQEALNNVVKHSKATCVNLALRKSAQGIELSIADNGRGFDPQEKSPANANGGLGLVNMRERAELSGGLFAIESAKAVGTVIRVTWPA